MARRRRYGLGSFIVDFTLTCLTGGIWAVYKIFKYIAT
jgi:hypothetical protein